MASCPAPLTMRCGSHPVLRMATSTDRRPETDPSPRPVDSEGITAHGQLAPFSNLFRLSSQIFHCTRSNPVLPVTQSKVSRASSAITLVAPGLASTVPTVATRFGTRMSLPLDSRDPLRGARTASKRRSIGVVPAWLPAKKCKLQPGLASDGFDYSKAALAFPEPALVRYETRDSPKHHLSRSVRNVVQDSVQNLRSPGARKFLAHPAWLGVPGRVPRTSARLPIKGFQTALLLPRRNRRLQFRKEASLHLSRQQRHGKHQPKTSIVRSSPRNCIEMRAHQQS